MKLINFWDNNEIKLGIKTEKGIVDVKESVNQSDDKIPQTMDQAIKMGEEGILELSKLIEKEVKLVDEDRIVYAPCVINPEKILCVGLNYVSHRQECDIKEIEVPVLFSKFNNALASHNEKIPFPSNGKQVDYEAELVIVIGKSGKNISKEDALSYVFGYTIGNDLSIRELQFLTNQWLVGKSADKFGPIGPNIVTRDEIDPNNLEIKCEVNGEVRQLSNTKNMIFNCASIISYASKYMTLKPGDIIFTGTPSGVILGYPKSEQEWLKPNDQIKISIENIGTLINTLE